MWHLIKTLRNKALKHYKPFSILVRVERVHRKKTSTDYRTILKTVGFEFQGTRYSIITAVKAHSIITTI